MLSVIQHTAAIRDLSQDLLTLESTHRARDRSTYYAKPQYASPMSGAISGSSYGYL